MKRLRRFGHAAAAALVCVLVVLAAARAQSPDTSITYQGQGAGNSAPFAMAAKAPRVHIGSPGAGAIYNWGQLVHLSGDALDPKDGLLTGTALTWSNQKGVLGTGSVLDVTTLPVGPNQITLTAQNSSGLSASAQVTIQVEDRLEWPGPKLEISPPALGFQFDHGSTAAKTQTIRLSNSGAPAALAWTATSSAPWLTLSVAGGANVPATLQVTASPQGLQPNVRHLAMLTVTGSPPGAPAQVRIVPVALTIGTTYTSPASALPNTPGFTIYLPLIDR